MKKLPIKLKASYDNAQEADTENMFLRDAFDIIPMYGQDVDLQEVQKAILNEYAEDISPVIQAAKNLLSSLNYSYESLRAYCTEKKISMQLDSDNFYACDQVDLKMSADDATLHPYYQKYKILQDLLTELYVAGDEHSVFVLQYCEIIEKEQGVTVTLRYFEQYDLWHKAQNYFDKRKENKIYYYWDTIACLFKIHVDEYVLADKLLKEGKTNEARHVVAFDEAMHAVMQSKDKRFFGELTLPILKMSLRKIIVYTEDFLLNKQVPKKREPQKFWTEVRKVKKKNKLVDAVYAHYGDQAKEIKKGWPWEVGKWFANNPDAKISLGTLKKEAKSIDHDKKDIDKVYKGATSFNRAMRNLFSSLGDKNVLKFSEDNIGSDKKIWIVKEI